MDSAPHASRTKPLCKDCTHAVALRNSALYCGHPSAPVDLVEGKPSLFADHMRHSQGSRRVPHPIVVCGPEGSLFAQRVGDRLQPVSQPATN